MCSKRHQNDTKMAPQIDPGSSKMAPERLTYSGGTHFGSPSGSQVTPSAPKATLGVPQGTLWAPHWAQTPLGPNRRQKHTPEGAKRPFWGSKVSLWLLPGSFGCCCCCRCRCSSSSVSSFVLCLLSLPFCFFLVDAVINFLAMSCSSLPRALDSITHAHNCCQNRAGGMRGAIE